MKYLIDTNALLDCPSFIARHDDIILVNDIFRELESLELRKNDRELQYQIRKVKRYLNKYQDRIVFVFEDEVDSFIKTYLPSNFNSDYVDNKLLCVAMGLEKGNELTFVTNDILLKTKVKTLCENVSVETTQDYNDSYKGVVELTLNTNIQDEKEFFNSIFDFVNNENKPGLLPGQYLMLKTDNEAKDHLLKYDGEEYVNIEWEELYYQGNKLRPKNERQKLLFDLIQDEDKLVKLVTGPMGAGKDYLMLSHALEKNKKIIWIRSNMEVKDSGRIGFLPGTMEEKLRPFTKIIDDITGDEFETERLINNGKLVIENLGHLRGRQFNNAIIYVTEAQNLTDEHVELLLGRVGENSEIWFNGDKKQSDVGYVNGLDVLNKLKGDPLFGKVELNEVERSNVANLVEKLMK